MKMKNIFYVLAISLIFCSCNSAQKTTEAMHPIVLQAKEISLYADQVNWNEVNSTFVKMTNDSIDLPKRLQFLINSLGDKHATIRTSKGELIASYQGESKGTDNRESDFVNNVINDISAQFSYQLLDNGIGYLKVVGIGPGNVKEQAEFIRKGLVDLNSQGVTKWILDLRYNGGGNITPMTAGLAPLLGDGNMGGGINSQGVIRDYKIENGQFYNWGNLACDMESFTKINSKEKVAVLLSRYTISSGELLAVMFKGRENTIFIGEATAGYTTGNGFEEIKDDLFFVISQDVYMDRNKIKYVKNVGVDIEIEFQHNLTLEGDHQIKKAKEWLEK